LIGQSGSHKVVALRNCCNTTQSKEGGKHPYKAYFDECGLIHQELHTKQSIFGITNVILGGGFPLNLV